MQYKVTHVVDESQLQTVLSVLSGVSKRYVVEPVIPVLDQAGDRGPKTRSEWNRVHTKAAAQRERKVRSNGFVKRLEHPAGHYVITMWREDADRAWYSGEFARRLMSMGYAESTGPSVVSTMSQVGLAELSATGEYRLTEEGKTLSVDECMERIRQRRLESKS